MKPGRKEEIIACCEGIIRNAEKITEDLGHDCELAITIQIVPRETPNVIVRKTFLPKEVIDVWNSGDVIE